VNNRPRLFFMEKAPQTAYGVEIDIASWLGTETIQGVVWTAKDEETSADVSSTFLDSGKHAFTGAKIKPWIRAGTSGHTYLVTGVVTTTVGSIDVFCVRVVVKDVA
jgi:hypothetical protein